MRDMANVVRLIPIAAVITPATLTIKTEPAPSGCSDTTVPMVDFGSLNFAFSDSDAVLKMQLSGGMNDLYNVTTYGGPEYSVTKTVVATAAQGRLLPISAPCSNCSWEMDFVGPATQCTPVAGLLEEDIINQTGAFR